MGTQEIKNNGTDGAEDFSDAEREHGGLDEEVTVTYGMLTHLYHDAYYSGIIGGLVNVAGAPLEVAQAIGGQVVDAGRNHEEFVVNTRRAISDRLNGENLDTDYVVDAIPLHKG